MKDVIKNEITQVLLTKGIKDIVVEVTKSNVIENGDYASNVALKLAKTLKKQPLNIAKEIVKDLNNENFTKIEIKAPGFINFFVKKDYLLNNINNVLTLKEKYGSNNIGKGKKVNIEFVSANPTGILHLGNARGGAYGDSLARVLSFSGYKVTKEYYINDKGNQINNLALSILARYKEKCGINCQMPEDGYYGEDIKNIANNLYEKVQDKYLDKNLEYFKELGINTMLSNIKGDLEEYRIIYDKFTSEKDIVAKYPPEEIITKLKDNGYIFEKDGAVWFKCSSIFDDKDHVLVKEDKSYTYLLTDISYHYDKYLRGYDKMIDVLGTDHHGYVNRLKSSVKALGNDPDKLEIKLLQLVRLVEDGDIVKMSKRKGKVVTLKDLIKEVGVNAARYYFVKYSLDTQMDFDLDLAKSKSNENPVYYISYAYARICSILKEKDAVKNIKKYVAINDKASYNVLEKVYEFPDIVLKAALKKEPHLIANYTYELAALFHNYYQVNRVITADEEATAERINLLKSVKYTISNALNLIGVIPPEKM